MPSIIFRGILFNYLKKKTGSVSFIDIITMDSDSESRKRKQEAPSGVSPSMKKVNSVSDFVTFEGEAEAEDSFLHDVASAFEKKSFIDLVTPSLNAIMEPIITSAINEVVTQAVTRLELSHFKAKIKL